MAAFLKALLNDLSYLMDDSFDRIADVQGINAAMSNSEAWNSLTDKERETKKNFQGGQV
jgi:hypothetical protein